MILLSSARILSLFFYFISFSIFSCSIAYSLWLYVIHSFLYVSRDLLYLFSTSLASFLSKFSSFSLSRCFSDLFCYILASIRSSLRFFNVSNRSFSLSTSIYFRRRSSAQSIFSYSASFLRKSNSLFA